MIEIITNARKSMGVPSVTYVHIQSSVYAQPIRNVHNMLHPDLGIDFLEINELLIG